MSTYGVFCERLNSCTFFHGYPMALPFSDKSVFASDPFTTFYRQLTEATEEVVPAEDAEAKDTEAKDTEEVVDDEAETEDTDTASLETIVKAFTESIRHAIEDFIIAEKELDKLESADNSSEVIFGVQEAKTELEDLKRFSEKLSTVFDESIKEFKKTVGQ